MKAPSATGRLRRDLAITWLLGVVAGFGWAVAMMRWHLLTF